MHEALVATAKVEAEGRHARDRAEQLYAHERKVAELTTESRARSLRRGLLGAALGILALATATVGFAYDARTKASRLEESASRIESLEQSLRHAQHDRDHARERLSLAEARIALLETKLSNALAPQVAADEVQRPLAKAPLPKVTDKKRLAPKPCKPDPNGDPLDDCVP
jgi:chromosome segregation ATPase